MEKNENGFFYEWLFYEWFYEWHFTNGYFSLGDEGEIDAKTVFKNNDELFKFIDKLLVKFDNHASIYYTGNTYRYF